MLQINLESKQKYRFEVHQSFLLNTNLRSEQISMKKVQYSDYALAL